MTIMVKSRSFRAGAAAPATASRALGSSHRQILKQACFLLFICTLFTVSISAASQTLDSVTASIGSFAITLRDVEQEYRFERFLDGVWPPPSPSPGELDSAREHLTYQDLLTREENPGSTEEAESKKAAAVRLVELRKHYARPGEFSRVLSDLGMTEAEVTARIAQQELMLRLIDQRLRPTASPSEDQVEDYYRSTFVPEFKMKNPNAEPPPLSEVESRIREILTEKRINELLDQWIEELKPISHVRFHSF